MKRNEKTDSITPDEQKLLDERKLALQKSIGITDKDFESISAFHTTVSYLSAGRR